VPQKAIRELGIAVLVVFGMPIITVVMAIITVVMAIIGWPLVSRSLLELWRRVVLAMDTPLAMFGFALLANADQGAVLRSGPFEVTFRHPGDANLVMELLEDDL
jgi:hypothetical protein